MNINESIAEWINHKKPQFPTLDSVSVVTMGETGDLSPPFVGIAESGSSVFEQGDLVMYGVSTYEVVIELHTVPASEEYEGTPADDERLMRTDLYDIIGNRDAIEWVSGRNFWTVFDIRAAAPITEAQEGRRVSRWNLSVVAAPL